jgi:subtilisin
LLGQSGIDGKFATSTQNTVKFQQDNRIPVDGIVGPITWSALCGIIPNSFIVQLKSASPSSLREVMGTLTPQLAAVGGRVVAVYDQFGMFNVVFERLLANPEQFINSLRAHSAVQAVFHDTIVTVNQVPQSYQPQVNSTGIDRVDADFSDAKSGDRVGDPVDADIAIIDSGVYKNHPDLNVFRCVTLISYFDVKSGQMAHYYKPNECYDGLCHGTRVAGIVAAKDNNYGVVGTAPGARIWAIKVLDNNGRGDESDTLAGLTYVAKYFKEIEVVNLSLGHFGCDSAITEAITRLVYKGKCSCCSCGWKRKH